MEFYSRFLRRLPLAVLAISWLVPVTVSAIETIHYTASNTFTLNVDTGNPNQNFGYVYVESDSATGWVLKVRSTYGGTLQHSAYAAAITYTLTVDGIQVDALTGGSDVTVLMTSILTCPPPGGCSLPVQANISTPSISGKPAGTYSDTLVFTLTNQ